MDTSHSPVVLPGWPHSRNVPTYDAHTRIYNRERVLQKKLTNMTGGLMGDSGGAYFHLWHLLGIR